MGNEIMTRDMKSLENSSRIQGEFALNSKGIHVEFSEDPRLTRGQTPCEFLFPRWEQNIPTLGTKHSHVGNKMGLRLVLDDITSRASRDYGSLVTRLRLVVILLLMMIVGVSGMKAQNPFTLTTDNDVTNGTETLYWIESKGATGFFAIPHTDDTRLTTSNMPNERMLWYFMDANTEDDTENGRQYYYVVNKSTGKYMKLAGNLGDANSIQIASFSASDTEDNKNKFRFVIVSNSGAWVLHPKNATNNSHWVNKDKGSVGYNTDATVGWFKASNYKNTIDDNSRWYFRERNDVTWAHPFTNSTDDVKHYYLIHNKHKNYTSYYMSTHNDYVSVSTEDNSNRVWYFKEAASDASIPNMKYYYIVNATTGNYMYFNSNKVDGSSLGSSANAVDIRAYASGENEDRYQFAIVNAKGDTYSAYSIMPKKLIGLYDHIKNGSYSYTALGASTMSNNSYIGTLDDRGSNENTAHWTIEPVWADPVVTCDLDGHITITNGEETEGAAFYYTLNGDTPTGTVSATNFQYSESPIVSAGITTIKVRAIADGKSPSNVVTKTVVYNPTITLSDNPPVYDGNAKTIVVKVGDDVISSSKYTPSYKKDENTVDAIINAGTYDVVLTDVEGDDDIVCGSGSFTINQKTLTITAEAKSKTYGDPDPELTYTSEGLVGSDAITGALSRNVGEIVGTYPINQGDLSAGNNYVISYTGANLTISKKALTITADSDSKEYDGTELINDGYINTALAFDDKITSVTVTGSQKDRGYSYNVPSAAEIKSNNGNGDDVTGCYDIAYESGTLTVTGRVITITAGSAEKVYDGTALTNSDYTYDNTKLYSGDAITSVTFASSQTEVGSCENVPSAAVIKNNNGEGDDVTTNYDFTYTPGTLTVTPAPATVTADAKEKVYGDADPTYTATVTGLVNGESPTLITYTFSRTEGDNIGEYTITPTGDAVQGNYSVTYATGKLIITRATATVSADNKTKGYGDPDPEFTATVTGLKNSDLESVITYSLSREEGEDVGTGWAITPSGAGTQGNYTVTYTSGHLTITPKNIGSGDANKTPAEGINIEITKSGDDYYVAVTQGNKTLEEGNTKDYTWSGTGTDTYVVTVTGHGNYTGDAQATFVNLDFYDTKSTEEPTETAAAYQAIQNLQATNDVEAWYVTDVNVATREVNIAKVETTGGENIIPEGIPVLLLGDASAEGFTLKPYTGTESVTITDNILQKSAGTEEVTTPDYYIFYRGEFVLSMWGTDKTMSSGKFYLHPIGGGSSPAPSYSPLRVVKNETTKVEDVRSKQEEVRDAQWYTLDGQKLSKKPNRKGIYIQNGKKVVIK